MWGLLLVANVPLYLLLYRAIFSDVRDLKGSIVAGLKPRFWVERNFWRTEEGWLAGKFWLSFLSCALLVFIKYEVAGVVLSRVLQ